jgi:hypothetical protein
MNYYDLEEDGYMPLNITQTVDGKVEIADHPIVNKFNAIAHKVDGQLLSCWYNPETEVFKVFIGYINDQGVSKWTSFRAHKTTIDDERFVEMQPEVVRQGIEFLERQRE